MEKIFMPVNKKDCTDNGWKTHVTSSIISDFESKRTKIVQISTTFFFVYYQKKGIDRLISI